MVGRAFTLTLLLLSSFGAVACDSDDTATPSVTGPSRFVGSATAVFPSSVTPEFRAGGNCVGDMPFDARIDVNVRPQQDVIVRAIGFDFVAPFGRRVRPLGFPGAFELNGSVLLPIPLPTSHPIPFPGEVKMTGTTVPAGAHFKAPFRLRFDCGVPAHGTLFVSVETADRHGTVDVSTSSVRIGN